MGYRISDGEVKIAATTLRWNDGIEFSCVPYKLCEGAFPQVHFVIYESSLRAVPGWRGSLYRHQGCFEASDCGRLGRQAAGHTWSALRVVKSCRKTAQRPRCYSKPKQQLCIQNGTRAYYLNYLQRGRVRRGKEAQAIGLASQSDGQKSDGQ